MALPVLPTTVVGSYPQPDWLVNREMLSKTVPRTRMKELWRVEERFLEQAQDDATALAIRDMEEAGMDVDNPGQVVARGGRVTEVPRIVGKIRRSRPVERRDMEFLRRRTRRVAKMTLPGPFTMSQQAKNEFYRDTEELVLDLAAAVNEEARDLVAAGADIIQLDEPWVRNDPEAARRYALKGINRALEGIAVPTIVHLCFGYAAVVPGETKPSGYSFLAELAECDADQISIEAAQPKLDLGILKDLAGKTILLGVLDLGDSRPETADIVAERIRAGLKHVAPERLVPAPDCGMKYLTRELAFAKLQALATGAAKVRAEIS
jgi:5-methyltetrahydropteroyltriglutamate--homocysteine methyltransferase